MTDVQLFTPGVAFTISSTLRAASLVRWREEALGNCRPT